MRQVLPLTIASIVVSFALVGFKLDEEVHPYWGIGPSSMTPGSQSSVTFGLDQMTTSPTTIALTSSNPGNISVPNCVIVPAGISSFQVTVTMATTATGGAAITASANSAQATTPAISEGGN